jgi:hypothetical protein
MELLAQFLLRLAFGLAFGMAITSPRQVTSGYFRNHLYVTLGLATLATLALAKLGESTAAWLAGAAAILSFLGAACWLYEASRAGKIALALIAACGLASALIAQHSAAPSNTHLLTTALNVTSSGLVLGLTTAAMLLGHWYLNAPGMPLEPLKRLMIAAALAVCFQALLSGYDVASTIAATQRVAGASELTTTPITQHWLMFVALRWSFGICGVLALFWMTWRTLEIPNTQSATGILYVAVIGVFVGELAAALLSASSATAI